MKQWVLDRLKEKTTWFGFVGFLAAAGVTISPELKEAIITLGLAIASFIAIITKEFK